MTEIAIRFDYRHAKAGWMDCWVVVGKNEHHLEASYAFPPFLSLLYFVKAVALQRLPAKFFWDEEGHGVHFLAAPVVDDSPLVHLIINNDFDDTIWIDEDVEREALVQAFLEPTLEMVARYWRVETEWATPRKEVARIHTAILRGLPSRSDVHSPQPVEFHLRAEHEVSFIEGNVFWQMHMHDEEKLNFLLFDTNPFWKNWYEFLDQVARAEFPAQFQHVRILDFQFEDGPLVIATRFQAFKVEDSQNFRLEVVTEDRFEGQFLKLNEVVNREQCVRAFARAFTEFIREDYQKTPDAEENTFDLRDLPFQDLQVN